MAKKNIILLLLIVFGFFLSNLSPLSHFPFLEYRLYSFKPDARSATSFLAETSWAETPVQLFYDDKFFYPALNQYRFVQVAIWNERVCIKDDKKCAVIIRKFIKHHINYVNAILSDRGSEKRYQSISYVSTGLEGEHREIFKVHIE